MSLTSRIITMMAGLTPFQVRALPPVERLRLAHECLRLLQACEVAPPAPKTGVLADLENGRDE
ncbi:MAG TPA: hypothetical protein VGF29_15380 [Hyphomicrobiaceae bacterium]|jgi:hypothetical protein